jgi:hypothetical protein
MKLVDIGMLVKIMNTVPSLVLQLMVRYTFGGYLPIKMHVILSIPWEKQDTTFTASRTALGPTQPRIQWVPGALSLGVKRRGVKLTTHLHLVPR